MTSTRSIQSQPAWLWNQGQKFVWAWSAANTKERKKISTQRSCDRSGLNEDGGRGRNSWRQWDDILDDSSRSLGPRGGRKEGLDKVWPLWEREGDFVRGGYRVFPSDWFPKSLRRLCGPSLGFPRTLRKATYFIYGFLLPASSSSSTWDFERTDRINAAIIDYSAGMHEYHFYDVCQCRIGGAATRSRSRRRQKSFKIGLCVAMH